MASPSVFSQNTTQSTGVTDTSHPVTFPTHAAGDMLLVDAIFDGNPNVTIGSGSGWATDWNVKNTTGSTTPTSVGLSKPAGGSSETLTLTSDVGEASLIAVRVVRGSGGTLNVFAPTPTSGSSTNGTGPAISPGAGSQDMLYCLSYGQDGVQHASAGPSGYGNFVASVNTTAARVDLATCEKASTASSSDTPGAWTAAAEQWISGAWAVWESASGASQSIAFTLEDVTASFAQTATHPQSLAATLDGIAVSIAQTLSHSQALAATLDDVSASIAQTAQHPQSLAITLDDVDATINQTIAGGNSQAIDFTLDGVTAAIAQTNTHPQSLVATLDGVTVAVAQTAQHPQALAVTLDGVSVAISQGSQHAQALAATLDGVSVDIQQSVSPANKDQSLAITLDGILVSIDQIGPAADEVTPTYVAGKKPKKKERKLMGGPRWKPYELADLSKLVTGRPFEEVQQEASKQAQDAIAKASQKQEIASISGVADALELLAKNEASEAQAIEAAILADQQALEDAQVMAIIAELL